MIPHGKVTKTQLNIKNKDQKVTPFPDHKAAINRAWQTQYINNTNDPQKKDRLKTVSKNILLQGLNQFWRQPHP